MKILDLFKKKALKSYSSLEEVIELASRNEIHVDDFYRSLGEFDLTVIVPKDYAEKRMGESYTFKGEELPILKGTDGSVAVFSSAERVNENLDFAGKIGMAAIKGATVFSMFPEDTVFVLNPFSTSAREILPEEVKLILKYK